MPLELSIEDLGKLIRGQAEKLQSSGFTCTCPAAESDGRTVVLCNVDRQVIGVRQMPLAIGMWCAGDIENGEGYKACPIWQRDKDGDGMAQHSMDAQAATKLRNERERHIATGMRVPDEPEQGYETDNVVQTLIDEED